VRGAGPSEHGGGNAKLREQEWREWLDAVTDWEMRRYFEVI